MTDPPPAVSLPAVGKPTSRYEARLKVTGRAAFPSDIPVKDPLWAFAVTSHIARGRITRIDDSKARAIPGVVEIYSYANPPKLSQPKGLAQGGYAMSTLQPLLSPVIHHDGEMIAVVVANSYESAREAAFLVETHMVAERATASLGDPGSETLALASISPRHHDRGVGDTEAALAASDVTMSEEYTTPTQHHNPLELFSTTAEWQGDHLTVHESSQSIHGARAEVARQLGIAAEQVHLVSKFLGGAFGSRCFVTPRTVLAAWIARQHDRPLKLIYTRDQGFTLTTFRAETRHRIRLGAMRNGKMTAYTHDAWELSSRYDDVAMAGTNNTVHTYAIPNIATKVHVERTDRNTPGFMRGPSEMPYMYALESAMDELACKLKIDPIELRRINDTMHSPINGARFSSRSLMRCYDEAAAAFGWSKRNPEPGSMRDGDWLIGWGCATAILPMNMMPASARVSLTRKGEALVQTASTDLGTGAYTVIRQTAAQLLGTSEQAVTVELGDSNLTPGSAAIGSRTTASACSAVKMACDRIVTRLGANFARTDLIEAAFDQLQVSTVEEYAEFAPLNGSIAALESMHNGGLVGITRGGDGDKVLMQAFGAELVEVRVNRLTREIRVPRIVGAFAAGRILNALTARSQYVGGMVWGIGSALHEATEIERRSARYTNKNIAEYLIPVNADVPHIEAIIVPEEDDEVNPMGVKGIGELSNIGTAAAIASAVYHATGKRIRDLPITLDKLL